MTAAEATAWTNHPNALLVVTSGHCAVCDSSFKNAPAVAIPDRAAPAGFVYAEARHLRACAALDVPPDPPRSP